MTEFPIPERIASDPNPEYVEILRDARRHLWDGVDLITTNSVAAICRTFSRLDAGSFEQITGLKQELEQRLNHRLSYRYWLTQERGVEYDQLDAVAVQAARLRWMNQLIEEFGGTPCNQPS